MSLYKRHYLVEKLRATRPLILPSLLLCDFGNLQREVQLLEEAGACCLHLDVMDGRFVPNFTYGMTIVTALRKLTELPLDVHLMMEEPEKYVDAFRKAGADILTIHAEAVEDPRPVLEKIRAGGLAAGLAINPPTSLAKIESSLPLCDLVLIMSVMPGFGGQSFDPVALEKMKTLRDRKDVTALIEVDGGVNTKTIEECTAAGAELLVAGSAIFANDDYRQSMNELRELGKKGFVKTGV